jgi:hypothetical protein
LSDTKNDKNELECLLEERVLKDLRNNELMDRIRILLFESPWKRYFGKESLLKG